MISGEGKFNGMHLQVSLPKGHGSVSTVRFVFGGAEGSEPGQTADSSPASPEMKFLSRDGDLVLMEANYFDREFVADGEPISIDEFEAEARRAIREATASAEAAS